MAQKPTLRWGILATGWISTSFTKDILRMRPDVPVTHTVVAVGTSSAEKGAAFLQSVLPDSYSSQDPVVYSSYAELYADPNVDVVYIGTPHGLHKQNCLDAIAAGKHVLCKKPFTINASETEEVIAAAKAKGVFLMEALWTRFFPIIRRVQQLIHDEAAIGIISRMFCDFGLKLNIDSLPASSRLRNPDMGAGALLDIGIYTVTFGLLTLDANIGEKARTPEVFSFLTVKEGIDRSDVIVLSYPDNGRTGILTASTDVKTADTFCRDEGTEGSIEVAGPATSWPNQLVIKKNDQEPIVEKFEYDGFGFYYEADVVAADIFAARTENDIMPLAETLRVMKIMDKIRKDNGVKYKQDTW